MRDHLLSDYPADVRPPACKLLGFPVLSNDTSRTQLIVPIALSILYSLNTVLQPAAPYKINKRAKTKHHYNNFTSVSPLLKCLLSVVSMFTDPCLNTCTILVGCDWISHHIPTPLSFPEILYAA